MTFNPRGWVPGLIERREHRFVDAAAIPLTYDERNRSVDATLSRGNPVPRFYGREVLQIDPQSVIVDRLIAGGIPLLNSHAQGDITSALGRVTRVWFDRGALMGKLKFNETKEGRIAEGMVRRGEITSVSVGYRVEEWEITDENGDIVDPETSQWRWDDSDLLTYTATRWELLEASLVCIPADASASIRSLGGVRSELTDIRGRMMSRQRIATRQAMYEAQARVFGNSND
jgi:phage head maturation protease